MQFAFQARETRADRILRSVGGARIHDRPVTDILSDRIEAAPDHMRFIFHNHAKAERRRHGQGAVLQCGTRGEFSLSPPADLRAL